MAGTVESVRPAQLGGATRGLMDQGATDGDEPGARPEKPAELGAGTGQVGSAPGGPNTTADIALIFAGTGRNTEP